MQPPRSVTPMTSRTALMVRHLDRLLPLETERPKREVEGGGTARDDLYVSFEECVGRALARDLIILDLR